MSTRPLSCTNMSEFANSFLPNMKLIDYVIFYKMIFDQYITSK